MYWRQSNLGERHVTDSFPTPSGDAPFLFLTTLKTHSVSETTVGFRILGVRWVELRGEVIAADDLIGWKVTSKHS